MPVIKHFYGNYNANSQDNTIYTVPSGKVARIEGAFWIAPNTSESTTRNGTFTFGNLKYQISGTYLAGGVINITQEGADFTYLQSSSSSGYGYAKVYPTSGSSNLTWREWSDRFIGMTEVEREQNYDMLVNFPPIYLGPSQTIKSSYNTYMRMTWQFVAIEEDVTT